MNTIVDLSSGTIRNLTFEARFLYGTTYLDHAGRASRFLLKQPVGWHIEGGSTEGMQLGLRKSNVRLTFDSHKMVITQTLTSDVTKLMPLPDFARLAHDTLKLLIDTLDLQFCSRYGFRHARAFGTGTPSAARSALLESILFHGTVLESISRVEALKANVTFERPSRFITFMLSSFEQTVHLPPRVLEDAAAQLRRGKSYQEEFLRKRKAELIVKSFPHYGVQIDIDAYIEYPPDIDVLTPLDFITDSWTEIEQMAPKVLEKRT